ncbi:hypothetical protein KC323_g98 [Hortaea werneckii]|nr:hypothetical protein KC323_g98 [Hortaea werneckii]
MPCQVAQASPTGEARVSRRILDTRLLHLQAIDSASRAINMWRCDTLCSRATLHSHVASIVLTTLTSDRFSIAAATRSLSPSCLLTSSAVLDVPSLIRTSIRNLGGRALTSRTLTPNPITVVREQAVVVGVIKTLTVLMRERGEVGGKIAISSNFTTPREPRDSGCSGSEMVEMRSYTSCSSISSRSSSSETSESDEASGEDNGSARPGYAGASASNTPGRFSVGADLRREGRSDGLIMVGFALSLSASMLVTSVWRWSVVFRKPGQRADLLSRTFRQPTDFSNPPRKYEILPLDSCVWRTLPVCYQPLPSRSGTCRTIFLEPIIAVPCGATPRGPPLASHLAHHPPRPFRLKLLLSDDRRCGVGRQGMRAHTLPMHDRSRDTPFQDTALEIVLQCTVRSHMDTLQAPAATGHTKQYVFVDEYNRHKRLKVMRACDGCRKRKIRCDGALQNGPWPCGACVRMKLKCIPPTLDPDDEQQASNSAPAQGQYTFQTTTPANSTLPSASISSQHTPAKTVLTRILATSHRAPKHRYIRMEVRLTCCGPRPNFRIAPVEMRKKSTLAIRTAVHLPPSLGEHFCLPAKHEESFKDVPRLSTVQGMILLTKAREFVPRRGYFYRSWMTLKYVVTMGCDLGLNEHLDQHRLSGGCTFSRSECLVRTRIWQTLFGLEIMIGSPQGRTDFSVDIESVDLSLPPPSPDVDSFEQQTSRRFTYLAQGWRNIMMTTRLWLSMRRYKRDWALDPSFIQHNEDIDHWLNSMPSDLRINYPADDSPPWLGNDHFLANVHVYQHLVLVMHHRPQLQALLERRDQGFVRHLDMCVHAAAMICKLHEALLRDFGLHGLHFMQRGINFTIYCVLSCAMLHLAAITSPDPDLNSRARTFFTRHMRVLEHCTSSAAVEMQAQINALREAFSNDTSKPFELKPSLGLRSPSMENQATPPGLRNNSASAQSQRAASWAQLPGTTSTKAISPSSGYPPQIDQVVTQNGTKFIQHRKHAACHRCTAIGVPFGACCQQRAATSTGMGSIRDLPAVEHRLWRCARTSTGAATTSRCQQTMYGTQQVPNSGAAAIPETTPPIPTVTPLMWQDAFTTAYVSGHAFTLGHAVLSLKNRSNYSIILTFPVKQPSLIQSIVICVL